ncbi:hypothetical protein TruAng_007546 [Truncatella angustata]|nr:hypothetical protein TruAng_007546 [Truncatella angustata]
MDNSQVAGTDKNVNTSRPSIYLGQPYHQSQSIFFRLPLEIRLMVYRELLEYDKAHVAPPFLCLLVLVDLPKKVRLLMWSDATTCWALDEKDAAALKPFLTTGLEQFQFDIRTRKLSDSGVPIYYWETLERQTEVEVSNHDDRHGAFKNWKVVDKGEITMQHYWRGS